MQAMLQTSKGEIVLDLLEKDAPNTVENFVKLAKSGFYDGTKFHRVIADFMIQGGDPLTKDNTQMMYWGTGGPGYKFADEIHANNHNVPGTIAMANAGPHTNGSQFFINTADNSSAARGPYSLDPKHTVFGTVVSGMDVVAAIEQVATNEMDRPLEPVVVERITIA